VEIASKQVSPHFVDDANALRVIRPSDDYANEETRIPLLSILG